MSHEGSKVSRVRIKLIIFALWIFQHVNPETFHLSTFVGAWSDPITRLLTQYSLGDVNKTSISVCLVDYTIPTVCEHPFCTKECGESEAFIQNFYFSRKYFSYKQMVGAADVHVHHFATKLAW